MSLIEQLPVWNATGTEPSLTLKNNGFQPGEKPAADHFNWLYNRSYKVMQELQTKANDMGDLANLTTTTHASLVAAINENKSSISSLNTAIPISYGATSGTNSYTVSPTPALASYTDGVALSLKIGTTNTGASSINVNGLGAKNILDSKGNAMTAGKLRATSIYTLRYNGTDFILQGEGGYGNAASSDLLSGKTASTDAGDITGTMPNNGAINRTPSNVAQSIPAGYTSGGTVAAVSVPAANVLTGTTIASTAGTMPNNGAVTITPSASNQTIAAGYHNGSGIVQGVSVPAANVLSGTTIAGTAGTMPNNGAVGITPSAGNQAIPAGYHNGSGVVYGDADLTAGNIRKNITIFGVTGNSLEYGAGSVVPLLHTTNYVSPVNIKTIGNQPPYARMVGGTNCVYYRGTSESWITKWDRLGNTVWTHSVSSAGFGITADGSKLYYADGYNLVKLNTADKAIEWTVPVPGSLLIGGQDASMEHCIEVDSAGNIYVLCGLNARIFKFNSSGGLIWTYTLVVPVNSIHLSRFEGSLFYVSGTANSPSNVALYALNSSTGSAVAIYGSTYSILISGASGYSYSFDVSSTHALVSLYNGSNSTQAVDLTNGTTTVIASNLCYTIEYNVDSQRFITSHLAGLMVYDGICKLVFTYAPTYGFHGAAIDISTREIYASDYDGANYRAVRFNVGYSIT